LSIEILKSSLHSVLIVILFLLFLLVLLQDDSPHEAPGSATSGEELELSESLLGQNV
jgi:preprotein translocase subunit SecG